MYCTSRSDVQQSSIDSQVSFLFVHSHDLCLPNLHSTPPLGGFRRNIAKPFGTEKLEWLGYPMVKKIEDTFIRFDRIHELVAEHSISQIRQ